MTASIRVYVNERAVDVAPGAAVSQQRQAGSHRIG